MGSRELDGGIQSHGLSTTVTMTFSLIPKNGSTVVNETIEIKTSLPIRWMLEKTFLKQHTRLFENINAQKIERNRDHFEMSLTDYDVLSNGADGGHHYASTEIDLNGERRRIIVFMDRKADEKALVEKKKLKVYG